MGENEIKNEGQEKKESAKKNRVSEIAEACVSRLKKAGAALKGVDAAKLKELWPRKFEKKHIFIIIGIVLVVFVVIKGALNIKNVLFGRKKEAAVYDVISEGPPVKVYKVKYMDFKDTLPVLGTIKGYKEVPLKFQTSGILESFNFEEGERIQEGDIIANLEQRDALLKLKYSELDYELAKKMFDIGSIVEAALEKSRLEYESARSELEKTNIYATADGLLGIQEIDVGTYVTPNDKIGMFVDISKVYAEYDVIEKDTAKLKLGQRCEVLVDALPNKNFSGTLDTISP
ncbi:MAG: efflux RND transporter periplasmic adaptor subunit, partial [Candidatus Omnitrophota bacterium]